jgi:hypothetical protein
MAESFAKFMATALGRCIRITAGLALMVGGYFLGGPGGIVVAGVGAVPLLAGAFNFCLLSPMLHVPFWGRDTFAPRT